MIRDERLLYPEDHIEIDNRLSWFLGKLDEKYGDNAFYVHLRRNDLATAQSLAKRIGQKYGQGIMGAYKGDIIMRVLPKYEDLEICLDYVQTVNTNIELFLHGKTNKMRFQLENAKADFARFWELIGAEGDLQAALAEWDIRHNASSSASTEDRGMTSDRINEVYYGKILSDKAHRAAQERVAWICQRVRGSTVLDIGCSQGIVSILLARAGKTVTGIDIDGCSLEYARRELASETDTTRERVTFIHGDALQQAFQENGYDTVIMGQLLEHVPEPEAFLALARRVCKPDGRVIITTPFGLLVSEDHRRTFYLYDFAVLVAGFFVLQDLEIVGKRICFVGEPGQSLDAARTQSMPVLESAWHDRIHRMSESEFARIELGNHEKLTTRAAALEKLRTEHENLQARSTELQAAYDEQQARFTDLQAGYDQLQARFTDLQAAYDEQQAGFTDLQAGYDELQARFTEVQAGYDQLQARFTELQAGYDEQQAKFTGLQAGYDQLQARLADLQNTKEKLQGDILESRNEYLHKINALQSSVRYRAGDALADAARSPGGALALPMRLWRIYWRYRAGTRPCLQAAAVKTTAPTAARATKPVAAKPESSQAPQPATNGPAVRATAPVGQATEGRVLFMPTNGAGLGHVTRLLAIARRLKNDPRVAECVFLTTSDALNVFRREGLVAYHFPSPDLLRERMGSKAWNSCLSKTLSMIIENHQISVFVFDGVYPYSGMMNTMRRNPGLLKVWVKRGMLKEGVAEKLREAERSFDLRVVPGELGQNQVVEDEEGRTVIPPVVYLNREELLTRVEAAHALGLDAEKKTVFVQPAAGNVSSIAAEVEMTLDTLRQFDDLQVVLTESIVARTGFAGSRGVNIVRGYPLSVYSRAFDLAICAAGYNTFIEMIYFGVPSIFIPRLEAQSDDQLARVALCEETGTGLVLHPFSTSQLREHVATLLDEEKNAGFRNRCLRESSVNGADVAARLLAEALCRS